MSAKRTHKLPVRHIQALLHAQKKRVKCLDMCALEDMKSVVLIIGYANGDASIYKTSLSRTQHLNFTLQHRWHAHNMDVAALHIHHNALRFVSGSYDTDVKVWNIEDITTPRLIKRLAHPNLHFSATYSPSGRIVTGCIDGVLRVYEQEPLLSLCWNFETPSYIYSVACSPSNRIAASFTSGISNVVQVWDSAFQTLFRLRQESVICRNNGLVFASNDLLISSGGASKKVYWYHMSKPKVMDVFMEKNVLPFCRDVCKIIITYLPFVTHVTHHTLPNRVGAVTALNSQLAISSCRNGVLYLYENKTRLLGSLPYYYAEALVTCVYPCTGKRTGFVLASAYAGYGYDVDISVTVSHVIIVVS